MSGETGETAASQLHRGMNARNTPPETSERDLGQLIGGPLKDAKRDEINRWPVDGTSFASGETFRAYSIAEAMDGLSIRPANSADPLNWKRLR